MRSRYERQGDLNELIDTGDVSKLHRDGDLNFGKDLVATWERAQAGTPKPKTMFYHASCCNVQDAYTMLSEEEGLHTLALRDRYMFLPLPMLSPYEDPPADYVPHALALEDPDAEEPVLKRSRSGYCGPSP